MGFLMRCLWLQLLPVRVDLENNPKFGDLVRLNASKAKHMTANSPVSLAQLAKAAGADKFDFSSGLHPVFQIAFLLDGSEEACRLSEGFKCASASLAGLAADQ